MTVNYTTESSLTIVVAAFFYHNFNKRGKVKIIYLSFKTVDLFTGGTLANNKHRHIAETQQHLLLNVFKPKMYACFLNY